MRKVQRKNYSEEFREKVLAAYYDGQETVLMIARRFGVKRDTVSGWVRRHDKAKKLLLHYQKASR
ncbi:MAG: transposase [Candidatus Symbiothrix sp.]|nr:transposase [Candidatus Symbiothrix sp.]